MQQGNQDLITFTQYGAIGYEIMSKYSNFRNSYIKYFKHKAKKSLSDNHKLDLMESSFDLYLLLEGAIIKYKIEKENAERDMIEELEQLKIYMERFNTAQLMPNAKQYIKIKDIYALFLVKIGVMDIYFKSKKQISPENALMGMEE